MFEGAYAACVFVGACISACNPALYVFWRVCAPFAHVFIRVSVRCACVSVILVNVGWACVLISLSLSCAALLP